MFLAHDSNGKLITPTKEEIGFCPGCKEELTAKMGQVNVHHWSHKNFDCDSWSEGETIWHYEWKKLLGLEKSEVSMGEHRADWFDGEIIFEVQNSPISNEELDKRNIFYSQFGKVWWILNQVKFARDVVLRYEQRKKYPPGIPEETYFGSFVWPRQALKFSNSNVILDFGHEVFISTGWRNQNKNYERFRESMPYDVYKFHGLIVQKKKFKNYWEWFKNPVKHEIFLNDYEDWEIPTFEDGLRFRSEQAQIEKIKVLKEEIERAAKPPNLNQPAFLIETDTNYQD